MFRIGVRNLFRAPPRFRSPFSPGSRASVKPRGLNDAKSRQFRSFHLIIAIIRVAGEARSVEVTSTGHSFYLDAYTRLFVPRSSK